MEPVVGSEIASSIFYTISDGVGFGKKEVKERTRLAFTRTGFENFF